MARETKIYGLIDPRDGQLRYVGKTVQPLHNRLLRHVSTTCVTTHVYNWILSLKAEGLRPDIFEIDSVTESWEEAEQHWIAYFRSIGANLTNLTSGGIGLKGHHHNRESRSKMSNSLTGRVLSAESRKRMSESKKLCPISKETRAKMAQSMRGKKRPPRTAEHCQKIADRARGRKQSEEANLKRSFALAGKPKSDEHRRRLSEAAKRRYSTQEVI